MTRKHKITLTIISNAIPFILIFFLGLLQTKVLMKEFGEIGFTSIGIAKQIITWILIIESGFIAATSQALYKPLAQKEQTEITKIINGLKEVYKKIAIKYIILLIIVAFIYRPIFITILVGIVPFFNFYFNPYRTLLISNQEGYFAFLLANLNLIFSMIFTIIFVEYFSLEILLIIPVVFTIIFGIITKIITLKLHPYLKKSKEIILPNKKLANANIVHSISGLVVSSTDLLLIVAILGKIAAAPFLVYTQISLALRSLLRIILEGFQASFANLMNENEKQFEKMYELFIILTVWLSVAAASMFILGISNFINVYYPTYHYGVSTLTIAIGFFIYFELIRTPFIHLEYMKKLNGQSAKFATLEAILNIIISIILIYKIGLHGAVLGTIITYIIDIVLRSHFIYKHNIKMFYQKTVVMIISSIIYLGIISYLSMDILKFQTSENIILSLVYMALQFFIAFLSFGIIIYILKKEQMNNLIFEILNFLRKKK